MSAERVWAIPCGRRHGSVVLETWDESRPFPTWIVVGGGELARSFCAHDGERSTVPRSLVLPSEQTQGRGRRGLGSAR